MFGDEEIFSVSNDHFPYDSLLSPPAKPIGEERTDKIPECTGQHHEPKIESSQSGKRSGKRHRNFRRKRNEGRLKHHEDKDTTIPKGGNTLDDP